MREPWNLTEAQRRQIREAHASAKQRAAHADGFMGCPCGRGDYDLCRNCPYDWCSVHGTDSTEEG